MFLLWLFYHFIIKITNMFYTVETIEIIFIISIIFSLSVAPKISSSCSRNSVIMCVCEAHGNPCPTLEWRLSGHVLTNSTETSISEEMLGSTGVKSILTTRQSLTDTTSCSVSAQTFTAAQVNSFRPSHHHKIQVRDTKQQL